MKKEESQKKEELTEGEKRQCIIDNAINYFKKEIIGNREAEDIIPIYHKINSYVNRINDKNNCDVYEMVYSFLYKILPCSANKRYLERFSAFFCKANTAIRELVYTSKEGERSLYEQLVLNLSERYGNEESLRDAYHCLLNEYDPNYSPQKETSGWGGLWKLFTWGDNCRLVAPYSWYAKHNELFYNMYSYLEAERLAAEARDKYIADENRLNKQKKIAHIILAVILVVIMVTFLGSCSTKKELINSGNENTELIKKVNDQSKTIARLQDLLDECEGSK